MIDFLIFSRNRPLQLHSLLASMSKYISGNYSVSVLHRYDDDYQESLNEIKSEFVDVNFIEESSFYDNVINYLSKSNNAMSFLVDDIVFKKEVDIDHVAEIVHNNPSIICFSLRLGIHLKHCYTRNLSQRIPSGHVSHEFFIWEWAGADSDWGYPLSVDGHVFRHDDILSWSKKVAFNSPNQYEDALQSILRYQPSFPNRCACFVRSKLFNIPANRVQNDINNRNEGFSAEKMLELWKEGYRINFHNFYDISNESAHFAVELQLTTLEKKC